MAESASVVELSVAVAVDSELEEAAVAVVVVSAELLEVDYDESVVELTEEEDSSVIDELD